MIRLPAKIFDLSQPLQYSEHTKGTAGTHCDAPCLLFDEGLTIDRLPLEMFVANAVIVDLRGRLNGPAITAGDVREVAERICEGEAVLFNTGRPDAHVTPLAAQFLVERGVAGVGIDAQSLGSAGECTGSEPAHYALLRNDRFIVEALFFPDEVMDGKKRLFVAFPVKLRGRGTAWTRATLWEIAAA